MGARDRRQRGTGLMDDGAKRRIAGLIVTDQHLAGGKPRKLAGKIAAAHGRRQQLAGGNVERGERESGLAGLARRRAEDRGEKVMRPGVEQALLGQRAWGDEAHHVAPDHGLRPALPRLGRVLDLLAHRDAMALRDQALEIFVGGMHRHAAHGDVLSEVLAALGERDAKRAAGDGGVLEEQLVEIAHAVEQEAIGIGRFDLQILGHHRRGDARGARGPHLVRARDVCGGKSPTFGVSPGLCLGHG